MPMEDRCNTGETRWLDRAGKELTESEYLETQKDQEKEVGNDAESPAAAGSES